MRRLHLAAASALALALAAPVQASNLTPDQLTQATSISNSNLLLIWPTGGPMQSVQWSVMVSQMLASLGASYLQVSNNLNDLGSPSAARGNLGLGSAAQANTGTTGTVLGYLSGNNVYSGKQTFQASTTSAASINLQAGVAPSTPLAGDCWNPGTALTCYIGGAAQTYQTALGYTAANAAGQTFSGAIGAPSLTVNNAAGAVRPIYYNSGGVTRWVTSASSDSESGGNAGSNFQIERFSDAGMGIDYPVTVNRASGLVSIIDGLSVTGGITGNLTGNVTGSSGSTTGNAATATALQTARTLSISGDLAYTSPSFDGSANVSAAGTLATVNASPGTYTNATVTVDAKGRVTSASSGVSAPTVAEFHNQNSSGNGSGEILTASAWTQRILNTTGVNTISGASLSGNQFTLPAGTYEITIAAPEMTNNAAFTSKARLRNITDSTTPLYGTSCFGGSSGQYSTCVSTIRSQITIAASKVFEVDTYSGSNSGSGYGVGSGDPEIFTTVYIQKVG